MDFCRELSASKIRISAVAALLLFTFLAIGLPLLITPQSEFDEYCDFPMNDVSRRIFLQLHNNYRSKAAKGKYIIKNNASDMKVLPPATRMLQFKYNYSLERSALKYACIAQGSMKHSGWGLGENLWRGQGKKPLAIAAMSATKTWGDEIMRNGIKRLDVRSGKTGIIGHATQMLWHKTQSVGCGIIYTKDGLTSVVCHYYPPGNIRGVNMYQAGETLSDCGKEGRKEMPHNDTGLCELL